MSAPQQLGRGPTRRLLLASRHAAGLGLVSLGLLGVSATQRGGLEGEQAAANTMVPPVLSMHTERLDGASATEAASCKQVGERVTKAFEGPVPPSAIPLVRLVLTATKPQPLALFEQALVERAQSVCAGGLSILQAQAAPGAIGILSVTAIAWRHPPLSKTHHDEEN